MLTVSGLSSLLILAMGAILINGSHIFLPASERRRSFMTWGALTYITLILAALYICAQSKPVHGLQWILAGLVLGWAARLGTYLFRRVHREGKDGRFDTSRPPLQHFSSPGLFKGSGRSSSPFLCSSFCSRTSPWGPSHGSRLQGSSFGLPVS